jgi:hypothetical protein
MHGRNIRLKGFKHFGTLAGLGGENGENVDHGVSLG